MSMAPSGTAILTISTRQPPQNTGVTRSTDSDRDRLADEALRVAGCTEIRFWDFQLKEDQGLVVDRIMDALDTAG